MNDDLVNYNTKFIIINNINKHANNHYYKLVQCYKQLLVYFSSFLVKRFLVVFPFYHCYGE